MVESCVPYRTKFRRTKLQKIWLAAENFVRRKFLSAENFVRRNILSAEILYMSNHYKSHVKTYFSCEVYGEMRNWCGMYGMRKYPDIKKSSIARTFFYSSAWLHSLTHKLNNLQHLLLLWWSSITQVGNPVHWVLFQSLPPQSKHGTAIVN